jgi:transposase
VSKREDKFDSPLPRNLNPTVVTKPDFIRYRENSAKKSSLNDPKLRKLRRQQMVMAKVMGLPTKKISEMFNLSTHTVNHEINMAKKDGTLEALNERIINELVPDAIDLYLKKMREEDDAFVAKDVLKHLERLTNRKDEKEKAQQVQYSMEAYIKSKQQLPSGETVTIEQRVQGEAAKHLLEQGNLEPAPPESMKFLNDIVVEKVEDE